MKISSKLMGDFSKNIYDKKIRLINEILNIYKDKKITNKEQMYDFNILRNFENILKETIQDIKEITDTFYKKNKKKNFEGILKNKNKRYLSIFIDILQSLGFWDGKISKINYGNMDGWGMIRMPKNKGIGAKNIIKYISCLNNNYEILINFLKENSLNRHQIAHGVTDKYDDYIIRENKYPEFRIRIIEKYYSITHIFFFNYYYLVYKTLSI